MKDIVLLIPNEDAIIEEYIDNLLLMIEMSDFINDDNVKESIEDRLNAFTDKRVSLSDIPHKNSLYYERSEYKNENLIYHPCYRIKCDKE